MCLCKYVYVFTFVFICVLAFSSFVCVFIWAGPRPTLFSRLGSCLPLFVCFPMHYALLLDQDFRIHTLNKYKYISEANTNIYLEEIQTRLPLFVCFPMHYALVLDQDSLSVHTIALTSSLLCTIENSQSMSK